MKRPLDDSVKRTQDIFGRFGARPRCRLKIRAHALLLVVLGAFPASMLVACRTRSVYATIVNRGSTLRLIEFDYPEASFGVDQLAAGGQYKYRFEIRGSGPLTLSFEDASGKTHMVKGPAVRPNQEGPLVVTIQPDSSVTWNSQLK